MFNVHCSKQIHLNYGDVHCSCTLYTVIVHCMYVPSIDRVFMYSWVKKDLTCFILNALFILTLHFVSGFFILLFVEIRIFSLTFYRRNYHHCEYYWRPPFIRDTNGHLIIGDPHNISFFKDMKLSCVIKQRDILQNDT